MMLHDLPRPFLSGLMILFPATITVALVQLKPIDNISSNPWCGTESQSNAQGYRKSSKVDKGKGFYSQLSHISIVCSMFVFDIVVFAWYTQLYLFDDKRRGLESNTSCLNLQEYMLFLLTLNPKNRANDRWLPYRRRCTLEPKKPKRPTPNPHTK